MGTVESTLSEIEYSSNEHNTTSQTQSLPKSHPLDKCPTKPSNHFELPSLEKVQTLRGIVCGPTQAGKSSLLHVLRGEDPNKSKAKGKRKLMALIPWTVQENQTVQLHFVERYLNEESWNPVDFVVAVLDRRKRDDLDCVLQRITEHCVKVKVVKHVCILLNFYDATVNSDKENTQDELTLDQVGIICRERLSSLNDGIIRLKFIDTCLRNSFGVKDILNFIHLTCLHWKADELQKELDIVKNSIQEHINQPIIEESFEEKEKLYLSSIHNNDIKSLEVTSNIDTTNNDQPKLKSFQDTPQNLDKRVGDDDQNVSNNENSAQTFTETHPSLSKRNIIPKKKKEKKVVRFESSKTQEQQKRGKGIDTRSSILKSSLKRNHKIEVQYTDPRKALEAFLASDDEAEEQPKIKISENLIHPTNMRRNFEVLESDSDDSDVEERSEDLKTLNRSITAEFDADDSNDSLQEDSVESLELGRIEQTVSSDNEEESVSTSSNNHVIIHDEVEDEERSVFQNKSEMNLASESTLNSQDEPHENAEVLKGSSLDCEKVTNTIVQEEVSNDDKEIGSIASKSSDVIEELGENTVALSLNESVSEVGEVDASDNKDLVIPRCTSNTDTHNQDYKDDDDDDEGFIIDHEETLTPRSRSLKTRKKSKAVANETDEPPIGISSAALSAIIAAQKEAEETQSSSQSTKPHKKKKGKIEKHSKDKKSKKQKKHSDSL